MSKKRKGENALGHLVSMRTAEEEKAQEAAPDAPAAVHTSVATEAQVDNTPSEDHFKRKTVHMRMRYVRLMKRIAALEDKDIKEVYDEAIAAYLEKKESLIERHDL